MLLYISLIYCQGQIPGRSQHIRFFAPINIQIGLQGFVNFVRKFRYIPISDREKQKQTNVQKEEKNAIIFESSVVILKNKITGFIFQKRKSKIIHS